MSWYGWRPYEPVAVRRARALRKMAKLRKEGLEVKPVEIKGRKIARTFWGEAWCAHLESFSDYENRLPRGRTYVRNGSVCHLQIARGEIKAMVIGSELYTVKVSIKTLPRNKWEDVKNRCSGQIGSFLELLQGRLSGNVMSVVTDRNKGLFPLPGEISLECSCPDWAVMCKHVAAVLYGVGARLDEEPELLFLLRGVDHEELISAEVGVAAATAGKKVGRRLIADDALSDVFGIEMTEDATPAGTKSSPRRKRAAPKTKKTSRIDVKRTARRKTKTGGKMTQTRRKTAGTRRASRAASSVRPVTGKAVATLRRKFGMSQSQFASLLGVSTPSIGNWEKKPGTLNLQTRTLDAWNAAKGLTKQQAWKKLRAS
ncbi:MAG: helix-turn-helix domain-containing protein [Candidatus Glassbacteria bacterium]|nr:helix-turn-helix domain-containing protein [Candidatus Glassbacteria bacterium]